MKSIIQFNNDSEFSLIKQPPLYFDYQSIRLIPYSSSIEYVKLLFSRVESFYIRTDEYDSGSYDTKREYKIIPNEVPGYTSDNYYEEHMYLILKLQNSTSTIDLVLKDFNQYSRQVLEYHSNSLEKVEIDFSNTKCTYPNMKYICPNQLESLKSLINKQSNNKINWSLSIKNQKRPKYTKYTISWF
ncbi:hypothetical protein DDB_G0268408 [Dictyostelium discoideum AX4]|uniref:Uncharacterized protein n=1 Tax=Dictyostelium discoideum TaxID=44689 RepID=Q55FS5_DICDI|nr:hypothetical protein DDB_G0268408 [Dictyostelium discoideum AX4]EAL73657.1 hypothetical protein DDB_G0268408 [Dictyostelium discoideum AX4]|eukprot:XP_647458.1 hypothetical protein DDB_G0268408 [Dictyostelium discoideum AX4]